MAQDIVGRSSYTFIAGGESFAYFMEKFPGYCATTRCLNEEVIARSASPTLSSLYMSLAYKRAAQIYIKVFMDFSMVKLGNRSLIV